MRPGAVKRRVCERSIGPLAGHNGCKSDYRETLKNLGYPASSRAIGPGPCCCSRHVSNGRQKSAARAAPRACAVRYCCF
jgi:hypothetical protein